MRELLEPLDRTYLNLGDPADVALFQDDLVVREEVGMRHFPSATGGYSIRCWYDSLEECYRLDCPRAPMAVRRPYFRSLDNLLRELGHIWRGLEEWQTASHPHRFREG